MFRSLKNHCPALKLWVLCLSRECYQALTHLGVSEIVPISLQDFEKDDLPLQKAGADRSRVEYYFTCTPSLPLYVFRHNPDVDLVTYLDSDLFFFSSPEPIFEEMNGRSIAIVAHRFSPGLGWMEQTGIYNVGWLSFRRDEQGIASLAWWRERCIEWCHDYVEADRYADQKYLDRFPALFGDVKVIEHKGANVAAWNLRNYRLHRRSGTPWVDDQPVLFYHFQGFRKVAPGVVDPGIRQYGLRMSWTMERQLYRPYMTQLREARRILAFQTDETGLLSALHRNPGLERPKEGPRRIPIVAKVLSAYVQVLTRHFLLAPAD